MNPNKMPHKIESTIPYTGAKNYRENNGASKIFVVTIDPNKTFTLGKAKFTLIEVTLGIRSGAFVEGTEFLSPTGRVRIMGGKLKYTRNKAIYKLPDIRV